MHIEGGSATLDCEALSTVLVASTSCWVRDLLHHRCSRGYNDLLCAQGYAFQMEIIVRARKMGLSIAEVRHIPSPGLFVHTQSPSPS